MLPFKHYRSRKMLSRISRKTHFHCHYLHLYDEGRVLFYCGHRVKYNRNRANGSDRANVVSLKKKALPTQIVQQNVLSLLATPFELSRNWFSFIFRTLAWAGKILAKGSPLLILGKLLSHMVTVGLKDMNEITENGGYLQSIGGAISEKSYGGTQSADGLSVK